MGGNDRSTALNLPEWFGGEQGLSADEAARLLDRASLEFAQHGFALDCVAAAARRPDGPVFLAAFAQRLHADWKASTGLAIPMPESWEAWFWEHYIQIRDRRPAPIQRIHQELASRPEFQDLADILLIRLRFADTRTPTVTLAQQIADVRARVGSWGRLLSNPYRALRYALRAGWEEGGPDVHVERPAGLLNPTMVLTDSWDSRKGTGALLVVFSDAPLQPGNTSVRRALDDALDGMRGTCTVVNIRLDSAVWPDRMDVDEATLSSWLLGRWPEVSFRIEVGPMEGSAGVIAEGARLERTVAMTGEEQVLLNGLPRTPVERTWWSRSPGQFAIVRVDDSDRAPRPGPLPGTGRRRP